MPGIKFPSGWRNVFERCVGRKVICSKGDASLLSTESAEDDNYCVESSSSGISRLDDSAYFSSDEVTDVAIITAAKSTSDISAMMDDQSFGTVCHLNLVCDELSGSTLNYQLVPDLSRVSSIQDRSLRITRRRHEKVARRRRAVIVADSTEGSSESDNETCSTSAPASSSAPIHQCPINRASSVQIRYWEIRQKRKDLIQKRRSRALEGCDNFIAQP